MTNGNVSQPSFFCLFSFFQKTNTFFFFFSSYIVDLEDVIDCGRLNFWPGDDFRMWQLASPQGRGVNEDSDPMVPPEHSKEHRYDSKEEYLASIATMHDR